MQLAEKVREVANGVGAEGERQQRGLQLAHGGRNARDFVLSKVGRQASREREGNIGMDSEVRTSTILRNG